jgi:hypothetical protein
MFVENYETLLEDDWVFYGEEDIWEEGSRASKKYEDRKRCVLEPPRVIIEKKVDREILELGKVLVYYSLRSLLINSDLVQFYTKFELIKKDRREYILDLM